MARVRDAGFEERRFEQPRVELAHHLRGAHRGEIGRSLMAPLRAEGAPEGEQHEVSASSTPMTREHHQRRLATSRAERHHDPSHRSASSAIARPSTPRASRPPRASWAPSGELGSARAPVWSCGARFSTTIGTGPTRAMHSAPTRASAGSTARVVTSTVWSATDAGAPPSAAEPASITSGAKWRAVLGQRERVRAGDQAQPTHRARAGARHVLERARETSGGVRGERDARGPHLAADRRRAGRIASGELRRERARHDGRAATARESEDADHRPLFRRQGRRRLRPRLRRARGGMTRRPRRPRRASRDGAARAPGSTRRSWRLHRRARRDLEPLRERAQQSRRAKLHPHLPAGDPHARVGRATSPARPHARPRAGRRRRRAPAPPPPPRCPRGRSSSPRRAAAPRRAPPREAPAAARAARAWPARAPAASRLARQRGHRRHAHRALPGLSRIGRRSSTLTAPPSVRSTDMPRSSDLGTALRAALPGLSPTDVSPRRRARRRRAQPERLAHQHELPPDQRSEEQRRHDRHRLHRGLTGFRPKADHAPKVPRGGARDNARGLRKRYS